MKDQDSRIVRTCCQQCHCECGVLVHVLSGRVVKIEGDADNPQNEGMMCPKGLVYPQLLYHPDRLRYPLKRVGNRGDGKWQRISWDEALDNIVSKLKENLKRYGPFAIAWGYGDGPRGNLICNRSGWFSALGGVNVFHSDSHYCFQPSIFSDLVTYGTFIISEVGPDYRNSGCIMIWGGNPFATHPTRGKDIMLGRAKGAKIIVIDPRFTALASKADMWLQVRPATDAALALGMLNVIINEGLYSKEFVEKWCVGFQELKQRVKDYPPDKVAEITWVKEGDIIQAARMYATTKPAALHARLGVTMNTNSIQTLRALSILIAITGNIDVKGGNVIRNMPKGFISEFDFRLEMHRTDLPTEAQENRIGAKEFPLFCGPKSVVMHDCHPPSVIKTILTGKPYPITVLLTHNDPLMSLEDSKLTREALLRLDFLVVTDFFMSPTAGLADIVLPAATWLEKDEICERYYVNFVMPRQRVIDPLPECRSEKEIAFEIAKRMDLNLPFPHENVEGYLNYFLRNMGITFQDLKNKGIVMEPMRYKKYEKDGFKTSTGKVELYSAFLKENGYDPLPHYAEPPESFISKPELAKAYPLILITGGRHIAFYDSANRQIPLLRELAPDPIVEIHPETAKKLGIGNGDWAYVETPRKEGRRAKFKADLTLAVHPRVVHAESHWWFPERKDDPERGCFESNINVVMSADPPYDPISGSPLMRGCLCKIYKA